MKYLFFLLLSANLLGQYDDKDSGFRDRVKSMEISTINNRNGAVETTSLVFDKQGRTIRKKVENVTYNYFYLQNSDKPALTSDSREEDK